MKVFLYASHDDGTLYPASAVDVDARGQALGYTRYAIEPVVTLTADELCSGDGNVTEILVRAGKMVAA